MMKKEQIYINEANSVIEEIEDEYRKLTSMGINPLAMAEFFSIKFSDIKRVINNIHSQCCRSFSYSFVYEL